MTCLTDPWDHSVTLIDSPKVEGRTSEGKIGPVPWALELLDPIEENQLLRCSFAGGATTTVAGMRANWSCSPEGSPHSYVGEGLGDPDVKANALWTVFYSPEGSSEVREASIVTVWR